MHSRFRSSRRQPLLGARAPSIAPSIAALNTPSNTPSMATSIAPSIAPSMVTSIASFVAGLIAALALAVGFGGARAHAAEAPTTTTATTVGPAPAFEPGTDPGDRRVVVVQVEGLIDPVNLSLIERTLRRADPADTTMVVLQVSSTGTLDVDSQRLTRAMRAARVPVGVWVGPARAKARHEALLLLESADVTGIAPGVRIGPAGPSDGVERIIEKSLTPEEAVTSGVVDFAAPALGLFVINVHGRSAEVATADGPRTVKISTAEVDPKGDGRSASLNQPVTFVKLGLADRMLHTFGSSRVAYMMLLIGFSLIMFELFAVSIGLAGIVGAGALVAAFTGFSHLPVGWGWIALIGLAFVAFCVELQVAVVGPYIVAGLLALLAGSFFMIREPGLALPWWLILIMVSGVAAFVLAAMPSVIRSRFSTPTIGRSSLIGEMGRAVAEVAPDGVVEVRGAQWRAYTNRATPIRAGEGVRVISIDGVTLEVEPEQGGARDYRDPKPARGQESDAHVTS